MTHFLKLINQSIKYWYLPLIAGIIFILIAVWTFAAPGASFLALAFLFSFGFVFSGAIEVAFSVANRKELENWGWMLVFGLVTFIVGILLFVNPALSAATLAIYIGFLVLFRSIAAVSTALDMRSYGVRNWGYPTFFGILGVIFSFILIWNPVLAGLTIVFWTGMALLMSGIFSIMFSLQLRKLHTLTQNIPGDVRERFEALREEVRARLSDR